MCVYLYRESKKWRNRSIICHSQSLVTTSIFSISCLAYRPETLGVTRKYFLYK